MGAGAEQQRAQRSTEQAREREPAHLPGAPGQPATVQRMLAMQRAYGNREVARLVAASPRPGVPAQGEVPAAERDAAAVQPDAFAAQRDAFAAQRDAAPAPRRLNRSFFGSIWKGIKSAASAVWSGVTSAAEWVWNGAKRLGGAVVDWLKSAASAVWDAIKWLGEKAWEAIKAIGTAVFEKLALLGSLAWDFVSFMPVRLWRVVIDGWEGISGMLSWLWRGLSGGVSWAWAWDGFKRGLAWLGQTFLQLFELVGGGDALQFVWGLIFHTRPLTEQERSASLSVHGAGLIPYDEVRVDQDSFMVKIGQWINKFTDPQAGARAVTTMHIIQAPKELDLETAVHELTHVAQYQKVGAMYMPQALHAQGTEMGYDYGDLIQARADGKHFSDFNREQQAQIAEDYWLVTNGKKPYYSGTEDSLKPFIDDMRTGAF